jgi:hypothetical protein
MLCALFPARRVEMREIGPGSSPGGRMRDV